MVAERLKEIRLSNAQSPLDTFPRSFPVDGEVARLLPTCYITDLPGTCVLCCGLATNLISDLMGKSPTCYGLATGKLFNGFWPFADSENEQNQCKVNTVKQTFTVVFSCSIDGLFIFPQTLFTAGVNLPIIVRKI